MSATAGTETRWADRARLAAVTGAVLRSAPIVLGLAASLLLAALLPAPRGSSGLVLWWTAVLATPLAVVVLVEHAVRWFAPLPFLLRLSLAFPDDAPRRLSVLRRVHATSGLLDQLRDDAPERLDTPPTAAATLALVTALQRHDRFTRGHSERVRLYADLLGEELALPVHDRDRLRWAALLHDIGKLRVDGEVLNKHGRPDEDEWAQLRRHPDLGVRLAGPLVPWLGEWADTIRDHHERFDGDGYPDGKPGDTISLGGRIVAVADSYETMTAGRPYRSALSRAAAREELAACAGTQFDPRIVRAFLALSLPRTPWPIALLAWLAQIPLLARLRAAPRAAVSGAATAAGVAAMAVVGLVTPSPAAPADTGPVAQSASEVEEDAPRGPQDVDGPLSSTEGSSPSRADAESDAPGDAPPTSARGTRDPAGGTEPGDGDGGAGGDPDGGGDDPGGDEPDGDGPDDDPGDDPPPDDDEPAMRTVGHDDSAVLTSLYLHALPAPSTRVDVLPMDSRAPTASQLGNYDTDVDGLPGLRLRFGGETAQDRRQRWALARDAVSVLAGPMRLEVWARSTGTGPQTVSLRADLELCAPSLDDCEPVSAGTAATTSDGVDWQQVTVSLDPGARMVLDERILVLTVTAGAASTSDVLLAFDTTAYPASLSTTQVALDLPAAAVAALTDLGQRPTSRRRNHQ